MRVTNPIGPGLTVMVLSLAATAPGQKDLRDVVTTTDGEEVRGRVVERYDPDTVLIKQGGRRLRIPAKRVQSMSTVLDHQRTFFEYRSNAKGKTARDWMLVEWAESNQLPKLARLQALHVLLADDGHEQAHKFLGHRRRNGQWLWKRGSNWMPRAQYERKTTKFGSPKILEGGHFTLRSNADLRTSVDSLLDLERLYVFWFDTFGKALQLREVLEPMDVHLHRHLGDFPAFTSRQYPYYFPQPNGDVAYTYLPTGAARPDLLFQMGTEQLLYNSLADGLGGGPTSQRDRLAAWVEIGLGQWVESRLHASLPGYAEPSEGALDSAHGATVLERRPYGLQNMIGLRYGRFHDPARNTAFHWASVSTFVAFLMAEDKDLETRANFLEFVRLAFAGGKGNSSSLLDRLLGTRIEKLERPWRDWVATKASIPATHR